MALRSSAPAAAAGPLFEEIPPSVSGISWVHDNAMSASRYLPETMGPGVAFFDYDNDGWMDIFLVNSGASDFYTPDDAAEERALQEQPRRHVHRRHRQGGRGRRQGLRHGRAPSPTTTTTATRTSWSPRTAAARSTTTTATAPSPTSPTRPGSPRPGWTTSAVWFDYDNDGKLDLFLCSFVEFSADRATSSAATTSSGKRFYCIPRVFKPTPSLLFHNNGDGTFTEVSAGTDIQRALGKALGVVATDINNDGLMDLFVANDTVQNFLFVNRGKGKWEEIGAGRGSRLQRQRHSRARAWASTPPTSTATAGRTCSSPTSIRRCSRSTGTTATSSSRDVANVHGVAQATRLLSGWGLKFFDYDNDGLVDLFLANGHPDDMIESYSQQVRYKEPLLLFHNDGKKLANVSRGGRPGLPEDVSRRAASRSATTTTTAASTC